MIKLTDEDIAQITEAGYKDGIGNGYNLGYVIEEARRVVVQKVVECLTPKLDEISSLVCDIAGDWTDPRYECREIGRLLKEIKEALSQEVGLEGEEKTIDVEEGRRGYGFPPDASQRRM